MTTTIRELIDRRRELVAQLAEVDAELASRHGEVDQPEEPSEPAAKKAAAKK